MQHQDASTTTWNGRYTQISDIFKQVIKRFYRPSVDLFASRTSHLLPQYVSRHPDPAEIATDAFLSDWSKSASAPDILALRAREGTSASAQATPNRLASIRAIAQRDFQQRLQEFSCPHEVRLPRNDILDRGTLGQAGVVNGRCVPLLPLSAISQTHDPIGALPLGELPIVTRFMKGVFRLNPPKPKLCSTWRVKDVLAHMQAQASVKDLGLKDLSLKLVLLLALTSAARAHEIAALDMQFLTEKEDSWEFSLAIHVKQSRPNHPSRRIYLLAYPVNEKLCVVTTLKEYRARTVRVPYFEVCNSIVSISRRRSEGEMEFPRRVDKRHAIKEDIRDMRSSFYYLWYPDLSPLEICNSIAHISLRRSSENYVSPSGKLPSGETPFPGDNCLVAETCGQLTCGQF
ncbi:Gag-Pro-Pol poly [Paramuricea clavata]|uniref:Gag-Pro-Pol poly n=1 Tax=Paramuricea clavata TaxID=317549 RepID=A0A6S7JVU8_PARCT|nr:Gag-Pro-Pol poly [Paramuricea clavata]